MGLDEFTTDGSTIGEQEDEEEYTGLGLSDNSPTPATQAFSDSEAVTPRTIKYNIESINANWIRDFSTKRFPNGELVMYASNLYSKRAGKTVIVFTTIQSIVDERKVNTLKPIKVAMWDLREAEPIGDMKSINHSGQWKVKLIDEITRRANRLEHHIE